ncbi:hypothetical protein [Actinocorallia aurea]
MKWLKALGIVAFWWLVIGTAAALTVNILFGLVSDDDTPPALIAAAFLVFLVLGVVQAVRNVRSGGARGRILPASQPRA